MTAAPNPLIITRADILGVMEPADYMGMIGPQPGDADNVYIVTGDSGNGMTHGTIAGILLTDLIQGKENPWAKLYDPKRFGVGVSSVKAAAEENLDVALQYTDWVRPGELLLTAAAHASGKSMLYGR